jgi:hypothetical protein
MLVKLNGDLTFEFGPQAARREKRYLLRELPEFLDRLTMAASGTKTLLGIRVFERINPSLRGETLSTSALGYAEIR